MTIMAGCLKSFLSILSYVCSWKWTSPWRKQECNHKQAKEVISMFPRIFHAHNSVNISCSTILKFTKYFSWLRTFYKIFPTGNSTIMMFFSTINVFQYCTIGNISVLTILNDNQILNSTSVTVLKQPVLWKVPKFTK